MTFINDFGQSDLIDIIVKFTLVVVK